MRGRLPRSPVPAPWRWGRTRPAAGQGRLVPVGAGILHPENGEDLRCEAGDMGIAVGDLLTLSGQGRFITHMAAGASAAAGIDGAAGIPAVRRGNRGRCFHPAEGVALFRLDDADVRFLPREHPGYKNRHAVQAADAFHFRAEFFRFQAVNLVFLHGYASFPRKFLQLFYQRASEKSTKCRGRIRTGSTTYWKLPEGP